MAREKLYVTVPPSLFRCPISMDVMRSPVSLCTGVTYDRSSIQNWLDSGHDTCPATMQVLSSKDIIPNLTLHRLIHLWHRSTHSLLSSPSMTSDSSPSKISTEQVRTLIHRIQNDNEDIAVSLSKIVEFVGYSDENRIFLSNVAGFDSVMIRIFSRNCSQVDVLEKVIRIFSLIMQENGVKERIRGLIFDANRDCLSSIVSVLQNGSLTSKIESAKVLEWLAGDVPSKRSIAETQGLLSVLLDPLRYENDSRISELHDAVLSCLVAVSLTQSTKTVLVRLGLVQVLTKTLQNPTSSNSTTERSMRLLAILSTSAEGRQAIMEEPRCVEAVVERVVKASKAATEDAVVVLWNMCCLCRNGKVQDELVKNNGVTKILLVLQRDCEEHVRRKCGELVKVLRSVSKDGLGRYETKTTHIKPC